MWLSKKRFDRNRFDPLIATLCALIVIVGSCRIHESVTLKEDKGLDADPSFSALSFFSSPSFHNVKIALADGSEGKSSGVSIADDKCKSDQSEPSRLDYRIQFQSPAGLHDVELSISTGTRETHRFTVAGIKGEFALNSAENLDSAFVTASCEAKRRSLQIQEWDALAKQLPIFMKYVAPDCSFSFNAERRLSCQLSSTDPSLASRELGEIQRTMIRRWNRQPYLLTRRLSIAMLLANKLKNGSDIERGLNTFCKMIQASQNIELPLFIQTAAFRNGLCGKGGSVDREALARIGLERSLQEIDALRGLFEESSRLGLLSVKVPTDQLSTKELLVSLEPESDVGTYLSKKSNESEISEIVASKGSLPQSCWHPFFSFADHSLQIATKLQIIETLPHLQCEVGAIKEEGALPDSYITDSITSETEFVIANGRSKMLRLPIGTYRYKIRPHFEFSEGEDSSAIEEHESGGERDGDGDLAAESGDEPSGVEGRGTISWSGKRPSAQINTLQ